MCIHCAACACDNDITGLPTLGRWKTHRKYPSWGCWSFPDGPEVKNPPSNAGDAGDTDSFPAWGTKITHDSGQLEKPAYHNQEPAQPKFNKYNCPIPDNIPIKKGPLQPLLQAHPHIQTMPTHSGFYTLITPLTPGPHPSRVINQSGVHETEVFLRCRHSGVKPRKS